MITIEDVARDRLGGAPFRQVDVVVEQICAQTGSVSIESAARSMETSVRSLQRDLRRSGTDFRRLVNTVRLQRATELLRHTNGTITRVSSEMGYSSPANFARAFRKASGFSPREFSSDGEQMKDDGAPSTWVRTSAIGRLRNGLQRPT
jgi:AraC-like DNA-binding protein